MLNQSNIISSGDHCLVIDNNDTMASSIKSMLVRMGYSERGIHICKTPQLAVDAAKQCKYKVIVSEYHFGNEINGQKLFEELSYHQTIDHETVFIIVTSENTLERVAAVVELNPDNYLLKPFNYADFKSRALRALQSKGALSPIIKKKLENDPAGGVAECDRLLKTHKSYKNTILKYKGQFLSQQKMFDKALSLYAEVNKEKRVDWAELGIANSLMHLDRLEDANLILDNLVDKKPYKTDVRLAVVSASLMTRDIPRAIEHLEFVNRLIPGNSVRELVFSYLCLAEGDAEMALTRYNAYMELNRNTYRYNIYAKLNSLRFFLYTFKITGKHVDIKSHQHYPMFSQLLRELHNDKACSEEILREKKTITAHMLALEGEVNKSVAILNGVVGELNHGKLNFNDALHLLTLLDQLHVDNLFQSFITSSIKQVSKSKEDELIVFSRLHLLENYSKKHQTRVELLSKNLKQLESALESKQDGVAFDVLSETLIAYPLLKNFSHKYIEYLAYKWPARKDATLVVSLFKQSLHTLDMLTDTHKDPDYLELKTKGFEQIENNLESS